MAENVADDCAVAGAGSVAPAYGSGSWDRRRPFGDKDQPRRHLHAWLKWGRLPWGGNCRIRCCAKCRLIPGRVGFVDRFPLPTAQTASQPIAEASNRQRATVNTCSCLSVVTMGRRVPILKDVCSRVAIGAFPRYPKGILNGPAKRADLGGIAGIKGLGRSRAVAI